MILFKILPSKVTTLQYPFVHHKYVLNLVYNFTKIGRLW